MSRSHLKMRLTLPETRPTAIREVVIAIESAGSVSAAASTLGVHPMTLHRMLVADEELRASVEKRVEIRVGRKKKTG